MTGCAHHEFIIHYLHTNHEGKNAEHSRSGYLVLMNGANNNLLVRAGPHDTDNYEIYDSKDYSLGNNDKNKKRVKLHDAGSYKDRVGDIVEETSGQPGQDGFGAFQTCALNKDFQCNLNDDPDMSCKGHSLQSRECTKILWWESCDTIDYTLYGCL